MLDKNKEDLSSTDITKNSDSKPVKVEKADIEKGEVEKSDLIEKVKGEKVESIEKEIVEEIKEDAKLEDSHVKSEGKVNKAEAEIDEKQEDVNGISNEEEIKPVVEKEKNEIPTYDFSKFDLDEIVVAIENLLNNFPIHEIKNQIENNQPLTITHPDITRYFMLIPEACQLVLQAAAIAENEELFILDMGEPIKIVDLAQKMLKIYDKQDLPIIFTGLRKGEKLYEELLIDESDKDTRYDSIFIAPKTKYDIDSLNEDIEELIRAEDQVEKLKYILPEFKHKI